MEELPNEEPDAQEIIFIRPKRVQLTAEESLRRMEAFPERQEKIIATVRESRDRNLLS